MPVYLGRVLLPAVSISFLEECSGTLEEKLNVPDLLVRREGRVLLCVHVADNADPRHSCIPSFPRTIKVQAHLSSNYRFETALNRQQIPPDRRVVFLRSRLWIKYNTVWADSKQLPFDQVTVVIATLFSRSPPVWAKVCVNWGHLEPSTRGCPDSRSSWKQATAH